MAGHCAGSRAAGIHFFLQDRARSIGDVRFAATEALEATAGAGDADGHAHLAALADLELLGDHLGDREDRARPVDLDYALRCRVMGRDGRREPAQRRRHRQLVPDLHGFDLMLEPPGAQCDDRR